MTTDDLRALHCRITDNDALAELHSADFAKLSEVVQRFAKRLHVVEDLLAFHCGCEVKDLREVAREIDGGHIGDVVVPGD